jgi:hypothetical protein
MEANPALSREQLMEEIRSLAGERVERSSLRAVASQLGMSPSGLSKFLGGASPYQKTVGKLEGWYLLQQDQDSADGPSAEQAAVAVRLLARLAPPGMRDDFVDELLAAIRRIQPSDDGQFQLGRYETYMRGNPTIRGIQH